MTDDIHEDILKRAREIPLPDAPLAEQFDGAYKAIARAIMEERERAARVVLNAAESGERAPASHFAAAIRSGKSE